MADYPVSLTLFKQPFSLSRQTSLCLAAILESLLQTSRKLTALAKSLTHSLECFDAYNRPIILETSNILPTSTPRLAEVVFYETLPPLQTCLLILLFFFLSITND